MFKVGSIRKIEVRDFVTYSYTEFYPGPNLNMIIGPNGTGKSTMVAAIVLGLGGSPKVIGRGHKLSEYVKHGCSEATINIYLHPDDHDKQFIKITRQFTSTDNNVWKLNDKVVLLKAVLTKIKQFNIQVDNLCQFLPQDRVQEFARLNAQELLRETQTALCRHDLIVKQNELSNARNEFHQLQQVVEASTKRAQEARDANVRLEAKVRNFQKKKAYLDKVHDIDRKCAWLQYDEVHAQLTDLKQDLHEANRILEGHRRTAQPLLQQVDDAKKTVQELQTKQSSALRAIKDVELELRSDLDRQDRFRRYVTQHVNEMEAKIASLAQQEIEIQEMESKKNELKSQLSQAVKNYGSDTDRKANISRVSGEIQKLTQRINGMENRREEIIARKQEKNAQLRAYERELSSMDSVKQQRLNYLQRYNNDAYQATIWLSENRHRFRDEVFQPMMLEINVHNPKDAVYLENVVPVRDRVAFTCVDKNDMNLLIKCLRDEQRLTVNVVHSGSSEPISDFQPNHPLDTVKQFGFHTYLHTIFSAPDPIKRYLCRTYQLHNIPIGNRETNRLFQQVPQDMRLFFSDNQRFAVNVSRYTGEKSVRQNEIASDGGLSISIDASKVIKLEEQIQSMQHDLRSFDVQANEINGQIQQVRNTVQRLRDDIKSSMEAEQQMGSIQSRIDAFAKRIEETRQERNRSVCGNDPASIRAYYDAKIRELLRGRMSEHQHQMCARFEKFATLTAKHQESTVKVEEGRHLVVELENQTLRTRELINESEQTVQNIRQRYGNCKNEAKVALARAKQLSDGLTPDDQEFQRFRVVHEKLPGGDDLEALQQHREELLSRIECLNTADQGEMSEYTDRLSTIEQLEQEIGNANVRIEHLNRRLDRLRSDWLDPLNELIGSINERFSAHFERMCCAGEVALDPAPDPTDYANYGVAIKVTYRHGEPLQRLNNIVQSGGERAVATAVYMLSLQELTPVPFRCVDEINQGMDANNERRIFEILVDCTAHNQSAQYFLITPKLVPNLKFTKNMYVHIVHNGPFVQPDRKWSASMLCNPQKDQIH